LHSEWLEGRQRARYRIGCPAGEPPGRNFVRKSPTSFAQMLHQHEDSSGLWVKGDWRNLQRLYISNYHYPTKRIYSD